MMFRSHFLCVRFLGCFDAGHNCVVGRTRPRRFPDACFPWASEAQSTYASRRTIMGTVVVGVDGSPGAELALRFAAQEAKQRGARLRVVTAWHVPVMANGAGFAMVYPIAPAELEEGAKKVLEKSLDGAPGRTRRTRSRTSGRAGPGLPDPRRAGRRRRVAGRGHTRARRLRRTTARIGQPAMRPPRTLPGRDRSGRGSGALMRFRTE